MACHLGWPPAGEGRTLAIARSEGDGPPCTADKPAAPPRAQPEAIGPPSRLGRPNDLGKRLAHLMPRTRLVVLLPTSVGSHRACG